MDNRERLNDPEEALRAAQDGRQVSIWTAMPGIVNAVNDDMTVQVQPTIQGNVTDAQGNVTAVNLPLLEKCPIVFPKAGNFALTFPIAEGDEVLVIIASRCIDAWWQSGGIGRQVELRMHDLSDGFAIPGPTSAPNVFSDISTTSVQLRNKEGTTFLEIDNDGNIKLTSPNQITLDSPLTIITGAVQSGDGAGGPYDASFAGNIAATGDVTAGTISLQTHIHPQSGGGDTGEPIP